MTSAVAFTIVKFVGAAYLLYMGIRAIFARASTSGLPDVKQVSASRAYGQGILVEVLNPKTALFFLAFFPQFVNPENGSNHFPVSNTWHYFCRNGYCLYNDFGNRYGDDWTLDEAGIRNQPMGWQGRRFGLYRHRFASCIAEPVIRRRAVESLSN